MWAINCLFTLRQDKADEPFRWLLLPRNVWDVDVIVKDFRQVGRDEDPRLEVEVHRLVPFLWEDIKETIGVGLKR